MADYGLFRLLLYLFYFILKHFLCSFEKIIVQTYSMEMLLCYLIKLSNIMEEGNI